MFKLVKIKTQNKIVMVNKVPVRTPTEFKVPTKEVENIKSYLSAVGVTDYEIVDYVKKSPFLKDFVQEETPVKKKSEKKEVEVVSEEEKESE